MNSKNPEEVRKRRAKASTSRLNLYQKTVLVAGVLTLFLAIGISPQLAPFLAAAVAGGTLLLFLVFRNLKTKKREQPKAAPEEAFPAEEEALDPAPISCPVDGKMTADSPEEISEQKDPDALQEIIPPEPEESITPPQPLPVEKEKLSPVQELSSDGVLSQIQERLAAVEEKIALLEDRVIDLAEKAASYQEAQLKSEPKIDLQSILSHLDEKEGKVV